MASQGLPANEMDYDMIISENHFHKFVNDMVALGRPMTSDETEQICEWVNRELVPEMPGISIAPRTLREYTIRIYKCGEIWYKTNVWKSEAHNIADKLKSMYRTGAYWQAHGTWSSDDWNKFISTYEEA